MAISTTPLLQGRRTRFKKENILTESVMNARQRKNKNAQGAILTPEGRLQKTFAACSEGSFKQE